MSWLQGTTKLSIHHRPSCHSPLSPHPKMFRSKTPVYWHKTSPNDLFIIGGNFTHKFLKSSSFRLLGDESCGRMLGGSIDIIKHSSNNTFRYLLTECIISHLFIKRVIFHHTLLYSLVRGIQGCSLI